MADTSTDSVESLASAARHGPERRYVTIMFVDLVGYTGLSEDLDPEDLLAIESRYKQLALVTVERYGGFVANLQGDGILVYFGYPAARENDAERAVRAGLELIERLKTLDVSIGPQELPKLAVRIGINSGVAVIGPETISAGGVGHGAVGEVVNIAARVQAKAPRNGVAITSDTLELVRGQFEFKRIGARSLKGFSRKIVIHQVMVALPAAQRLPAPPGSHKNRMIGREASLGHLLRQWQSARWDRRCRIVHVYGEAGLGKTRLVREFCGRPEMSNAAIVQVQCQELFAGTPLYPVGSFLWTRLSVTSADDAAARQQKVAAFLRDVGLPGPENERIVAGFLDLARSGVAEGYDQTPQLFRRKQYDFICKTIAMTAKRAPTIFWVDDVHWLDPSSAELLIEIVDGLTDQPVLVILTARSFPKAPTVPPADETIRLEQLAPAECRELAMSLPGVAKLPENTIAQAIEAAEGVPLFVEQLIRSFLDEQSQTARPNRRPAGLSHLLAEMMSERLDRRPGGRRIVQAAACIGRSFRPDFLASLLHQEARELGAPLESLVEAEILLPRRYGAEILYEFRHSLLQRIAYETMIQDERIAMHGRVADVLQQQGSDLPTVPEVLALHLTRARRYGEAVASWLAAGVSAARRSGHAEAIDHLRRGLELLHHLPDAGARRGLELHLQAALMSSIIATQGATSFELEACCERGLELCREGEPTPLVFPFVFGQFTFANCRGRIADASKFAGLFLSLSEQNSYNAGRVIGNRLCGMIHLGRGDAVSARDQLELSLAQYSPERDAASTHLFGQNAEVHNRSLLALALFCLGDIEAALAAGHSALSAADALRHPHSTAIALTYVGGWIFGLSDASEHLLREATRLQDLCEQHRLGGFRPHGLGLFGWALCQRGEIESGIALLEKAIAEFDAIEYRLAESGFLGNLAEALSRVGRIDDAVKASRRALDLMLESSYGWCEAELLRIDALVHAAAAPTRRAETERRLRAAVDRAAAQKFPVFERRCLISLREQLGPSRRDGAVEARLKALAPLDDLARTVARKFQA